MHDRRLTIGINGQGTLASMRRHNRRQHPAFARLRFTSYNNDCLSAGGTVFTHWEVPRRARFSEWYACKFVKDIV
jgi:hypothetical protein